MHRSDLPLRPISRAHHWMSALLLCAGMSMLPAQAQQVLPLPDPDLYGSGPAQVLLRQPDGRVLVGGRMHQAAGTPVRYLARYEANGTLDASWTPQLAAPVTAMALDSLGQLYVLLRPADLGGGTPVGFQFIRRLDTAGDGSLDPEFLPAPPSGTFDTRSAILLDEASDGLYVSYPLPNGTDHIVVRYRLEDGSRDQGFVLQANSAILALALADGALIVGGSFSTINSQFRRGLARISLLTGAVDESWDPAASTTGASSSVQALLVAGDHLFAGGGFQGFGDGSNRGLARISLSTGLADPTWNAAITGWVSGLDRDSQGRVIVSGTLQNIGGVNWTNTMARFLATGQHDSSWSDPGIVTAQTLGRPLVLPGDDVLALHPDRGDRPARVLRHATAGGQTSEFSGDLLGIAHVKRAFAVEGDTLLAGDLLSVDGVTGAGAARIDATGAVVPGWRSTWGAELSYLFLRDAVIGGDHFYLSGVALRTSGPRIPARRLSLADGSLDASWIPDVDTEGQSIAFDPVAAQVYIAAYLTGGSPLSRHNASDGAVDTSWTPPQLNGAPPFHMGVAGGHLYVGGAFFTSDGSAPRSLARFPVDGAGEADLGWVPTPAPLEIGTLAVDLEGGWVYAARPSGRLFRYHITDGTPDPSWAPFGTRLVSIDRLVLDPEHAALYVIGSIRMGCDGTYVSAVRMYSSANRIDPRWRVTTDGTGAIEDAVPQEDGSVLLVGRFEEVNGVSRRGVAMLSAGDSIFADGMGDHTAECVR